MSGSVAFLNPTYWPEVARGSERYIDDLARGLRERGWAPHLITSHPARADETVEEGLPVRRVKRPRGEGWLRRRGFDDFWTHVPAAARELRRGDDVLAHAFYPTDAVAAGRWTKRTGRPSILSVMGIPNPLVRVRFDAVPRAARSVSVVTALSRWAADGLWWRYGIEARVIYPGVDLTAFAPGERAAEPTIFCAATPDVARKRVPLLVEAFARVRRERPGARLVLVRPGSAALAAQLEAVPGVSLVSLGPGEVREAYASAWVSALPSVGEAFGLVLIESMACGTPAVGTDAGAFGEIVDSDGVGRLFDGGEAALARALLEALELSEDPATAARCRARAERFSMERSVGEVEALYRELLGA
ncbi:MAG TPA: glycosyltransferase family 4 protein [Capillimicrobium sp.]|nr:glycosyltransferase family 4 protein [Capillimicrobium sp.]